MVENLFQGGREAQKDSTSLQHIPRCCTGLHSQNTDPNIKLLRISKCQPVIINPQAQVSPSNHSGPESSLVPSSYDNAWHMAGNERISERIGK